LDVDAWSKASVRENGLVKNKFRAKNLFKHLFMDLSLIIAILINKAITIHNIKMCKS